MKKVTKIEGVQNNSTQKKKLKVAAYCRVSTQAEEQLHSLAAQREFWKHRKPIMSDTSIPVRIGSSPVSTSMKVSQEPRLKNVRSYFA